MSDAAVDVTALSGLLLGGTGFGFNEFLRRYGSLTLPYVPL